MRSVPLLPALAVLAVAVFGLDLMLRQPLPGDPATAARLGAILFWQGTLPRAATALLAGAALGLAGTLLQRTLRNPIADPSTLGIAAGAQLALALATAFAPALLAVSREVVAFAGGGIAVAIVLAIGWRKGLEPATVVLSGMTIALMAGAVGAAIVLAHGDYMLSLFIWGAGSLHQQSWDAARLIAIALAVGACATGLLGRPLALLGLDDATARGLGLGLLAMRFLVIAVAVGLAAFVTASVGVIGFIGLAAPAIARLAGNHRPGAIVWRAPMFGALLLWLTDGLVQLASRSGADLVPTGAATALLGGPLLLWLLPRLSAASRPPTAAATSMARIARPGRMLGILASAAIALAVLLLCVGRDFDGMRIVDARLFMDLLPFRLPRLIVAAGAGALLGAAGALLQRLTGNPLAGPEVLGVGAGAGVGLSAVLLSVAMPSTSALLGGSIVGSVVAVGAILVIAAWSGFGPERLLLAGIALGALSMAVLSAVLASGDSRAFTLLTWMAGGTDRAGPPEAIGMAVATLVLILPLLAATRWLDILPLGSAASRALGLPLGASRLILAAMAAVMTAVATYFVGPLGLVGLIAPHLARFAGFARGVHLLVAAALIGGELMMLADWLGRIAIFPYQIPIGLCAALIGGPALILLVQRNTPRHG